MSDINPQDLEHMTEAEIKAYLEWLAEDERNGNYD